MGCAKSKIKSSKKNESTDDAFFIFRLFSLDSVSHFLQEIRGSIGMHSDISV